MKVKGYRKLGAALGVSHTAAIKASKTGRIKPEPDGSWDIERCRRDLAANTHPIKSQQARAQQKNKAAPVPIAKQAGDSKESLPDAICRKETALANLREIEEATKRAELIDVSQIEQVWATVGQTIRDNLLGMPDKLTPMLAAMTDKKAIRTYLMESFRQLLTALPDEIHKRAA